MTTKARWSEGTCECCGFDFENVSPGEHTYMGAILLCEMALEDPDAPNDDVDLFMLHMARVAERHHGRDDVVSALAAILSMYAKGNLEPIEERRGLH